MGKTEGNDEGKECAEQQAHPHGRATGERQGCSYCCIRRGGKDHFGARMDTALGLGETAGPRNVATAWPDDAFVLVEKTAGRFDTPITKRAVTIE